jgi:hypothetical protein
MVCDGRTELYLDEFQSKKDLALDSGSFKSIRIQSMLEDNGRPTASRSDNTVLSFARRQTLAWK